MPCSKACDRCHALKSVCLSGPAGNCYRCYRLHRTCTFSRRRGKRGPKPRPGVRTPTYTSSASSNAERSRTVSPLVTDESCDNPNLPTPAATPAMTILHQETLLTRVSAPTGLSICSFFTFGPQLSMDMYRTICSRAANAPLLLLKPYAAVSRVFIRCSTNQSPCSDTDWSVCASALQTLRNAHIKSPTNGVSFVALGMSLVTFHRLVSGISASTICRFTLALIRPYYYAGQLSESDSMELTCLIFLDTTQSLFRARVPVIEYRVLDPWRVDQHAGLCGSLLPLLYRLCILAAAVKSGGGSSVPPRCFDELALELHAWSPNVSSCLLERFSEGEALLLTTQANAHRTGALLYLHRLRYPFGERDEQADELSASIIDTLEHCLAVTGQLPPNMTLTLLVAGAEVQNMVDRQRILYLVSRILGSTFYPFIANLRLFLWRVWSGRDRGRTQYLFQLFQEDLNLSIPL